MPSNNELTYQIQVLGTNVAVKNIADLDKLIKLLTVSVKQANVETAQFGKRLDELRGAQALRTQLLSTNTAIQGTQTASANASMALLNLNYVVRDSPYFFNNFALGVLAVGNNINPLIDSFARLRQEAGEKSISTFALLRQALVGGAGISIAFSLVVTAIQSYVFWQSKAKDETKKTNDELETQTDRLKEMSRAQLVQIQAMNQLRILQVESEALRDTRFIEGGRSEKMTRQQILDIVLSDEQKEEIRLLTEQIQLSGVLLRSRGILANIEAEITALKEKQKNTTDPAQILSYENQIKALDEMAKRLRGITKEMEKQKDIYSLLKQAGIRGMDKRFVHPAVAFIAGMYGEDPFSQFSLRENLGMTGGQKLKNPMDKMIKDIEEELKPRFENITQIANIAGNAISNAFLSGKNAIEAATQALLQFVTQLLFVTGIKSLLGFAIGGAPGAAIAVGGFPKASSLNKGTIQVTGRITADKNNFIADIKNAENYYNKNEQFITIGR